jgi:Ca-activated chloride channel family protein
MKLLKYALIGAAMMIAPLYVQANENVMLVLDVSGSMWGQINGVAKIEIARDALKSLVENWSDDREVGLVAYGHREKGSCSDIEVVMPVGPLDAASMNATVAALQPKGKTPLSAAVKMAAEALKYTEDRSTVILISDGKETCDLDPCEIGTELEKLGVDLTVHVIGFDVKKIEDQAGLQCLATNTGGQFISA